MMKRTIELSAAEVEKVLRRHLSIPADADVVFIIGAGKMCDYGRETPVPVFGGIRATWERDAVEGD